MPGASVVNVCCKAIAVKDNEPCFVMQRSFWDMVQRTCSFTPSRIAKERRLLKLQVGCTKTTHTDMACAL